MSKQLHRGEQDRRQQVKFRADEQLVAEFDAWVEASDEYDSRAEALRASMRRTLGDADETGAPREPPADEELRTAYLTLVSLANYRGTVPHKIAIHELTTKLAKSEDIINRSVLGELRNRGYLQQLVSKSDTSDRAWRVRGVEDGA